MKRLVGGVDSKAAETQTVWLRARSPGVLSSPHSFEVLQTAGKKMPLRMLRK